MPHYLAVSILVIFFLFALPVWWWSQTWGCGPAGGVLAVLSLVLVARWRGVI